MSIRRTFLCGMRPCHRRITVPPHEFWNRNPYDDRAFYCWQCSALGEPVDVKRKKRRAIIKRNASRRW